MAETDMALPNPLGPWTAERVLRGLGVTGNLYGFRLAVYMIERVQEDPEAVRLITKCLYRDTAKHFNTTDKRVERNMRTLVRHCWENPDHELLDQVAGYHLTHSPTNAAFLDMVGSFLRRLEEQAS